MEELKVLIEAIAGLPDLAIWVIAMYFFFKIAVVGSVYGVIRFVTQKIHDVIIKKKEADIVEHKVELVLNGKVITSNSDSKVRPEDIEKLLDAVKRNGRDMTYIFREDIYEAIAKIEKGD
jgi:hypothetical protein